MFVNDNTSLYLLRACPPSRGDDDDDDDDDGFPCWERMCFLLHVGEQLIVVSSDASEDAVIHGDSRKLGR
jgi:hypothetical protein